jgi:hypothetical protein
MKTHKLIQISLTVIALAALAAPARADTMSVPSKEKAAFTVDIPSNWKPKGDASDESVEAAPADEKAYLVAWTTKASDEKALTKDLEATLKDALKKIDGEPKMEEMTQNGSKFYVISGDGVDKREGNKVHFLVGIFETGPDLAGVVYTDVDADAPADTMKTLMGILNSIKVVKK